MRFTIIFFFALIFCPLSITGAVFAELSPPAVGGTLPKIILTVPGDIELQQYLGLAGKKTFTIPEIKAEIVLIQIFSMY
jgi:hypothetical protein